MTTLYGGIEAGGTKFICAVGEIQENEKEPVRFLNQTRIPTTQPEKTIAQVIRFFQEAQEKNGPLAAVGVGSFGPVDVNPGSPTYGSITATPKPFWSHTRIVAPLQEAFGVPVGFDTDVNVAAFGEWTWGAARGLDTFIYLTVGTGIGGGGIVNGQMMHGLIHPEMGHILIPHDRQRDPFPGNCPFHMDCFEGLANGPALERRWGQRGETLPPDHTAWELEAEYISLGLVNYILSLSPQRIILGGGVMAQRHLYPMIWARVPRLLNAYVQDVQILEKVNEYIVPPGLGTRSGILGAIALARSLARDLPTS
jgi:fructokinase